MKQKQLLVVLLMLCMVTGLGQAEIYRWKDDGGKVVFGDTPPKNKAATAVNIENTENSGTRFATPSQVKSIEHDAKNRQASNPAASRRNRTKIDSHCRRYISELNKVDIYLEHTDTPRDQLKARDLRKLIKKECGNKILTRKFDDRKCIGYRRKLSKTETFLEHTPNPRDEQQVRDLKKQLARECQ